MSVRLEPSWHGVDPDAPDFRDRLHEGYAHLRAVAPVSLTPRGAEQWRRLLADPSLVESAVEECLRYDPSVVSVTRYLHEDAEFGGYALPTNTRVVALVAAANRDPEVFEAANVFDIGRKHNPHLAFSAGPHVCLGAYLARLEARAALRALAARAPGLRLESERVTWRGSLFRVPASLPVRSTQP